MGDIRTARRAGLAVAGFALLAAGLTASGVAGARVAAPAAGTQVNACVNSASRVVTVPAAGNACSAGTTALSWDARGPAGPPGSPGSPGSPELGLVASGPGYHLDLPGAVVSDGTHLWICNTGDSSVTELNAGDGSFVRNLSGGSYNFDNPIAMAYDGAHIWVVSDQNNSVTELNASDGTFVRNLAGAAYGLDSPQGIAFADGSIWIANTFGNSVTEVNASTGSLVQVLSDSSYDFSFPGPIAFDGRDLWVANTTGQSVTELRAADGSFVRNLSGTSFDFDPSAITFASLSKIPGVGDIWVANSNNTLTEISTGGTADGSLVRNVRLGFAFTGGLAFDGRHIWVTDYSGESVAELDDRNGSVIRMIAGGSFGLAGPIRMVAAGGLIWVVNFQANSLTGLTGD